MARLVRQITIKHRETKESIINATREAEASGDEVCLRIYRRPNNPD